MKIGKVWTALIVVFYICCYVVPVLQGWNKGNLFLTTLSHSEMERLKRYIVSCQFSYQIPQSPNYEKLRNELRQYQLQHYEPFYHKQEIRHVSGYVLTFPDEIVVAFRGTIIDGRIRRELFNNLNNRLETHHEWAVHRGVLQEYKEVYDDFARVMSSSFCEKGGTGRRVVFTGHSLGAMCQIAALEWQKKTRYDPRRVVCVTFGAYKIFNDTELFRRSGMRNIRVRFKNDYVSYYPLHGGFTHANTDDVILFHKQKIEHRIIYYKRILMGLI